MAGGRPKHPDILTPAEWRVLAELRRGRTNIEIADALELSANTVKYHVANMLSKLELGSREELAAWDRPKGHGWHWLLAPRLVFGIGTGAALLGGAAVVVGAILRAGADDGPGALAFVGYSGDDTSTGRSEVYVIADGSSAPAPMTADPGTAKFSPVWSPDGTKLAYLAVPLDAMPLVPGQLTTNVAKLMVMDDSGGPREVAHEVTVASFPLVVTPPAWRPDGGLITFSTQGFITSDVNVDGSERADQLMGCIGASWMPNSRGGVCVGYFTPEETVLPISKTQSQLVIGPVGRTFRWPETRIPGRVPDPTYPVKRFMSDQIRLAPSFSGDGKWLAWWEYGAASGDLPHVLVAPVLADLTIDMQQAIDVGVGMTPAWAHQARNSSTRR